MEKLSVIIIVQDEEKNIAECLQSVSWADEIVVVDAFSQDRTLDICRRYTDKIFQQQWPGFAEQKRFALEQATCPWVLSIDADERVTPELKDEIQKALSGDTKFDGYNIPRKAYFLGQWIKGCGWYPGYQLRLFKKDKAQVSQSRVHEGFLVNGPVGFLKSALIHLTHPSLEDSFEKLNRYSTLEALDRMARKKVRWYDFFSHPLSIFLNKYFVQKGFRDGIHGLMLSLISAMVKLALYMKLWELQNRPQKQPDDSTLPYENSKM